MDGVMESAGGRISDPQSELAAGGWRHVSVGQCPKGCGQVVRVMESPSGTMAYFALNGRMHLNCREEPDQVVELPPVPDQEEMLRKAGYVKL